MLNLTLVYEREMEVGEEEVAADSMLQSSTNERNETIATTKIG